MLENLLTSLLGVHYRIFFVPIITAMGTLIAVNRLSWNFARFFGLLMFWVSVTSLSEMWDPSVWNGNFDFFDIFKDLFSRKPAGMFLVVLFFLSLYLTLRISYRKVISHLHSKLPSVESVKGVVKEFQGNEKSGNKGVEKKMKAEYDARRKEIEEELKEIRKERDREKRESEGKPAAIQTNVFNAAKHIPIIKKEPKGLLSGIFGGDGAASGGKPEKLEAPKKTSPDFATWEFPPISLLNHVKHQNVVSESEIREKSLTIESALSEFGIKVSMMGEKVGPTVVQYRLDPADEYACRRSKTSKRTSPSRSKPNPSASRHRSRASGSSVSKSRTTNATWSASAKYWNTIISRPTNPNSPTPSERTSTGISSSATSRRCRTSSSRGRPAPENPSE
ncbi:MAG: FtsK protein [Patescibacteria group bacterium]|nr:FtsK protein [Patescibacteria group bacterium]